MNYNTEYLAYCAGLIKDFSGCSKDVPVEKAHEEFMRRIKSPGKLVTLACLKAASDYLPLARRQEDYYDGPSGPYARSIVTKCTAFGQTWNRSEYWIDKGRDIRRSWYMPESTE